MAWSNIDIIPASVNPQAFVSTQAGAVNPVTFQCNPLTSIGGPVDCTGVTAVQADVDNGVVGAGYLATAIGVTIVSQTATGMLLQIPAAALQSLPGQIGGYNTRITIVATNGTPEIIGVGRMLINEVA